MPRSGFFILGIKSKSQGLKSGEYGGWYSISQPHRSKQSATACAACGRALSCKMMDGFCRKCHPGLPSECEAQLYALILSFWPAHESYGIEHCPVTWQEHRLLH
ncbi:hypothetical protein AVEN_184403-1 [Araneus ventricosus]|uniref:Uncharacterized protein n=1 Tax=Araneus ventricosus TaxID=182803 RepID=A0A4Y2BFH0_ARAVE|nr:hypothetical protein AVEN_184403-1 [Araneus ventricosus]